MGFSPDDFCNFSPSVARSPVIELRFPPSVISYGKFSLLPDCAIESHIWRGRINVARQTDARIRAADVPLAPKPSSHSYSWRRRSDRLSPSRRQDPEQRIHQGPPFWQLSDRRVGRPTGALPLPFSSV